MRGFINLCMRPLAPDLHVVAAVDPNEETVRRRIAESHDLDPSDLESIVFYDGLDEMVRKARLDALAIGTPCNLHTPYAIEAAKHDLPLFLEKPVATSMDQALVLEKAFEKTRCRVVVSFPMRNTPLCRLARLYIDDGTIGAPEHILSVNYVPYGHIYFDGLYRNYEVVQGLFVQKATHDFDCMAYLMGSDIVRVAATASLGRIHGGDKPAGLVCSQCGEQDTCPESPASRGRAKSAPKGLADHPCLFSVDVGTPETGMNEDSSNALVEFASGAQGVYTQLFYCRRDAGRRGSIVTGYEGTISFDSYRNELTRVRHHEPFSEVVTADPVQYHFGGDTELARNFLDVIRGRAESRTPIRTGLQSIYACLAAKQSSQQGRFVDVRRVGGIGAGKKKGSSAECVGS